MLTAIWARLSGYLAAAGAVLTVLVGVFFYGRADGREDAQRAIEKANAAARTQAKDIENEINGLDDRGVGDGLAKWLRDDKR
ncbi:hypothetical protein [Pararhizobium sp. O133]|uniref:hypothetical protein n=1 Tax=Pararhizobium sp. O133 TaxID=3449278 RepID=UPI003F68415F